eukprot:s1557_g4.t1
MELQAAIVSTPIQSKHLSRIPCEILLRSLKFWNAMAAKSLPDTLDLGFVALKPRVGENGLAELVLQAADNPFTQDGVERMTDYIDVFLEYNLVKKGFSIVYDLRLLRVPSLMLVKQLADWGRDPKRQQTFQRLNRICKVVVTEGWRMGVAKRILGAFFAMCPPVCSHEKPCRR